MLRRGLTGRRLGLAVALVALGAMACAGIALAASDMIVAGPSESFSAPTYNTDQGEVVPFQDVGGSHNVTARANGPDGKSLFRTPTISSGTAAVNGTQYLAAGDYPFFCTVHPTTMNGTLHVTGNGTPQARPSAALTLRTKTISKAVKKGLLVSVNANTQINGAMLTAKLGKATIASTTASLASGTQTTKLKLSKAGKSKLRKKSSAKVTVTADIPFGAPASAKAKLK
jgi:plastocyanin